MTMERCTEYTGTLTWVQKLNTQGCGSPHCWLFAFCINTRGLAISSHSASAALILSVSSQSTMMCLSRRVESCTMCTSASPSHVLRIHSSRRLDKRTLMPTPICHQRFSSVPRATKKEDEDRRVDAMQKSADKPDTFESETSNTAVKVAERSWCTLRWLNDFSCVVPTFHVAPPPVAAFPTAACPRLELCHSSISLAKA